MSARRDHVAAFALLLLCLFAALVPTQSTGALWQDEGTSPALAAQTGRIDLLNGSDGDLAKDYAWTSMALGNMAPGDSRSDELLIHNDGTVPMRYRYTGLATSNPALPLVVSTSPTTSTWRVLEPGETDRLTVTITLDPNATNSAQAQSGHAVLTFTGEQAKHR